MSDKEINESDWVRGYVEGFVYAMDMSADIGSHKAYVARNAIDGLKNAIKELWPEHVEGDE